MANVPPDSGAKLWDDAQQSGIPQVAQNSIPRIVGGPQGKIFGYVGMICTDDTGALWVKSTNHLVNTGWRTATLT